MNGFRATFINNTPKENKHQVWGYLLSASHVRERIKFAH